MSQAYEKQEIDKLGNFTGCTPHGYTEFIGAGWKKECDPKTGHHPATTARSLWAAKIRAALKVEQDTDFGTFDPSKVKLTVHTKNYSGGGSITITIEDIADIWRFCYREDCQIRQQVKQIASQWNRYSSHHVSDYYSSNFILFVNYGGPIEDMIYDLPKRPEVTDEQFRDRAVVIHGSDEIQVESFKGKVAESNDGAWVEAWVWVPLSDFNEPEAE